ncbi:MAG: hypothetical protein LBL96_00410 [Clostridiales bacterium]|jgi:hypothetical protein|nr:hypothetical protein [Clostridiales bacterium]
MIILNSARKHGISDADIRFVYENAINSVVLEEFPLKVMLFGFDTMGRALEIGYFVNENKEGIIMHAMKIRKAYQEYLDF